MEGASMNMYRAVRRYWRRRRYKRLPGSSQRPGPRADLSSTGKWRGRLQHVRLKPRLKLRGPAPIKKLFISLRDKYVKMMVRFSQSSSLFQSSLNGGSSGIGGSNGEPGWLPVKEYDPRMIIKMYQSLVVAHGGHPVLQEATGDLGSE